MVQKGKETVKATKSMYSQLPDCVNDHVCVCVCVCVCIRSGEDNLAAGRCAFIFFCTSLTQPFALSLLFGSNQYWAFMPSCYPFYSQDRLCSTSCRKSSFFHALLENCHAPQYLATRQHNSHHLTLRSSLHNSFLIAIDVTAF